VAVDDALPGKDLFDVDLRPASERPLADRAPERTGKETLATAAELVVANAAIPEVTHLSRCEHSWHLAQQ